MSAFIFGVVLKLATQTKTALCTSGDEFPPASQRADYLSVCITTVQTGEESRHVTRSTLVHCAFVRVLLSGCWEQTQTHKGEVFSVSGHRRASRLHHCITFRPVRCTKDFAIEWKFDLLPKRP